jgi:hypothetical protein
VYAIQRKDDASPVVRGFIAKAREILPRMT